MVTNIFSSRSSRVLRVLLVNVGRGWSEREVARIAEVSTGMAHYVCSSLIEAKYVTRNESNRMVLTDPLRLLKRWAAYHQYDVANRFLDYFTFEREIEKVLEKVALTDQSYAATALAGAWLVAPYLRPVDLHFYVPDRASAENLAEQLGLNPIPRGGNVKFVVPYDEGVFYGSREVKGVEVVSNIQLYVDLFNYPSRGEEAASRLLDQILEEWHERRREG